MQIIKKRIILLILFLIILVIIFLLRNFSFWNDSWLLYSEIKSSLTKEEYNSTRPDVDYNNQLEEEMPNIPEKTEVLSEQINSNNNLNYSNNSENKDINSNINSDNNNFNSNNDPNLNNNSKTTTPLPSKLNNITPFIVQAPLGNWDQLHEEACEETSLLIAHYFLKNQTIVLSKEAEEAIQKLTSYTKNVFPKKDDVTVEELKTVAEKYFNYQGWKIINNPTIQNIKQELFLGNIIIAPMAGRELSNPFFKNPGPLYHMLVISGYNEDKKIFITQDPGTKRGQNFEYSFDKILNSLHDFPGQKEKIKEGKKNILVVSPLK